MSVSNEQVAAEVKALQRDCFGRLLADYIGCAPEEADIKSFAKKYPDRYFAAMAQIAQLAGYKRDVNISGTLHLTHELSDSDLYARLAHAEQQLLQRNAAVQIKHDSGQREPMRAIAPRTIEQDDAVIDVDAVEQVIVEQTMIKDDEP